MTSSDERTFDSVGAVCRGELLAREEKEHHRLRQEVETFKSQLVDLDRVVRQLQEAKSKKKSNSSSKAKRSHAIKRSQHASKRKKRSGGASDDRTFDSEGAVCGIVDICEVKQETILDPYGEQGVYTGFLLESTGMPHGKGRMDYGNGCWYEGDWKHGRWTGRGRLSSGDGDLYEGELRNDHKHGKGTMCFTDGRAFVGEYHNSQMIEGRMTYQDGSTYEGSWADGQRHGRGKCVFVDDSVYEGEFFEGEFHGNGRMSWTDGAWYEGEWLNGEMHGILGKEIRPDGSVRHEGAWSQGQPEQKWKSVRKGGGDLEAGTWSKEPLLDDTNSYTNRTERIGKMEIIQSGLLCLFRIVGCVICKKMCCLLQSWRHRTKHLSDVCTGEGDDETTASTILLDVFEDDA